MKRDSGTSTSDGKSNDPTSSRTAGPQTQSYAHNPSLDDLVQVVERLKTVCAAYFLDKIQSEASAVPGQHPYRAEYTQLREILMQDERLRHKLPDLLKCCDSLDEIRAFLRATHDWPEQHLGLLGREFRSLRNTLANLKSFEDMPDWLRDDQADSTFAEDQGANDGGRSGENPTSLIDSRYSTTSEVLSVSELDRERSQLLHLLYDKTQKKDRRNVAIAELAADMSRTKDQLAYIAGDCKDEGWVKPHGDYLGLTPEGRRKVEAERRERETQQTITSRGGGGAATIQTPGGKKAMNPVKAKAARLLQLMFDGEEEQYSGAWLAEQSGLSRRDVSAAVTWLKNAGAVTVIQPMTGTFDHAGIILADDAAYAYDQLTEESAAAEARPALPVSPDRVDMKDFFISYNKSDREWAEWVAWVLEAVGYTTIIQDWDFRPGANFVVEMDQAAKQASRTIAILSPNYLSALYTHPEWATAFAQDPTGAKRKLLPVRVAGCNPEGLLSQVVYIDMVGLEQEEARNRLLAGVQSERAKPSAAPLFPGKTRSSSPTAPTFPGSHGRSSVLPKRPVVEKVADLRDGKQVLVPVTAIEVSGNRQCFIRRDAECFGDDCSRRDVVRLGAVSQGSELILHLHTLMQEHRWSMNQRVGSGVPGFLPIMFIQSDPLQALPPVNNPFWQDTIPATHLDFTVYDLQFLAAGSYSISSADVLVTGRYEDEARYWLLKQATCRAGHSLDVAIAKGNYNGAGSLTISLHDVERHGEQVRKSDEVTQDIERDYIEVSSLPVLA